MKILVTGGAGFIGSHLCEALLQDGHKVICLDNFDPFYHPSSKWANIAPAQQHPGYQLIEGDIRDHRLLQRIFTKNTFDAVVHLAAKAGVRPSISQPDEYFDVNVRGTLQLLEAMAGSQVPRLLFASSSSVYGNQAKTPFTESDDVSHPISPYAASKRSGELLAHAYHHLYGLDVACLRLFTVYGPRQRPDLAIHKFAQLALEQKPIPLYGNGQTRRDYTYVADIVQGIRQLLHQPGFGYEIFNLGGGAPVTLKGMVRALEITLGQKLKIEYLPKQAGDVDQTFADISKANAYFGYQPAVSLPEGVKRFVAWFLQHEPAMALMQQVNQ